MQQGAAVPAPSAVGRRRCERTTTLEVSLCAGNNEARENGPPPAPQVRVKGETQRKTRGDVLLEKADLAWSSRGEHAPLATEEDEVCGVCADERVEYVSVTCKHAACGNCWREWLAEHDSCWLCGTRVDELRRTGAQRTRSNIAEAIEGVRTAVSVVVKRLVAVKHRSMELTESLREVDSHLRALSAPGQTLDAVAAVLTVEQRVLASTAAALVALAGGPDASQQEDGDKWRALQRDAAAASRAASRAATALDGVTPGDPSLQLARESSACLGVDIAAHQWSSAKAVLDHCAVDALPKYKGLLCTGRSDADSIFAALVGLQEPPRHRHSVAPRPGGSDLFPDAAAFDTALARFKKRLASTDATLDDLFSNVLLLKARLESCFSDANV